MNDLKGLADGTSSSAGDDSGLRTTDYLAIGISAGLLALLYVAALVVYLCYRRRRRRLDNVHVKLTTKASPVMDQSPVSAVLRVNPLIQPRAAAGIPNATAYQAIEFSGLQS